MSAREMADAVAAAVRASLLIAAERDLTIEQALAGGIDQAIGNNAAYAIALAGEVES